MKQIPVKAVSAFLATSMLLSVAACNKNGDSSGSSGSNGTSAISGDTRRSGEQITEDTPWFDGKVFDVDLGMDQTKEIDYSYTRVAGCNENQIVLLTYGYYKMPDMSAGDWENFDYESYSFNYLTVVDKQSGSLLNSYNLSDLLGYGDYVEQSSVEGNMLMARTSSYDAETFEQVYNDVTINLDTGAVVDSKQCDADTAEIERSFEVGDYKIDTEIIWEDVDVWYKLHITSADGSKKTVELKEAGKSYYDVPVIFYTGDNKALVPVNVDNEYRFFILDLETYAFTEENADNYEWLNLDMCYSPIVGEDGCVYFSSSLGVSRVDFENKTTETFFNYSWCGINRSMLSNLDIVEITDDSVLLCGQDYRSNAYQSSDESAFMLLEFTRADSNPHAGKTVLELFSPYGYTEDKIGDAIVKYNESSTDYFIEVCDRYTMLDDTDYSKADNEDDYQKTVLESEDKMSNELAMDILNGEGPDILMNASYYGQLCNSNYLTDLTPYIGDLDPDKYFTNVIEASKTDGMLFNLPVCFIVEGIQTDASYAGASGVGFTTEEYEAFLRDVLNGKDVLDYGQAIYFSKLFNTMRTDFIKDGKVDFTSPEFEALAEFVKDNVNESAASWYSDSDDGYAYGVGATIFKGDRGYGEDMGPALFTSCYGMSTYLTNMVDLQGGSAILGLPSSDGRGPSIAPYISVAVSAQATDVDACAAFVKMLLSDEVQLDFAMKDNFVLSRDAFRTAGEAAVEYYNGEGYDNYYGWGDADAARKRITFSEQNIDDMENIIMSCSNLNLTDAAINLVLVEEMPSYFSGQKDLADVAAIAQDRCQKVLDERG